MGKWDGWVTGGGEGCTKVKTEKTGWDYRQTYKHRQTYRTRQESRSHLGKRRSLGGARSARRELVGK